MSDEKVYRSYTVLTSPKNWAAFKIDAKVELIARGHWQIVSGNKCRPQQPSYLSSSSIKHTTLQASASISLTNEQQDWDDHNGQALAILLPRLGKKYRVQYATVTSASALWEALCNQHETPMRRFDLVLELARLTLAGCNNDINVYSSKFLCLRGEQILVNGYDHRENNFTEAQLVMLYISGLQSNPRWEPFVLNFMQNETLPSLEMVVCLSREEQRFRSKQKRLAKRRA